VITNPILPGFHPDPSICRVGEDYYIATSTFEWWPAVRIHHSKDLMHWRHAAYAVTRESQLNLRGHDDSAGVWAPCLSHAHGLFWLIYSDVRAMLGAYKDVRNLVITAASIDGPWSEPVELNRCGFDPSLFHDDDGRSWFLNQLWLHHPGRHPFHGIVVQEFDREQRKLVGPVRNIFGGTALGVVEGPHLYKKDAWYYLLTAEGGTSYEHAATVARSRSIGGPYEVMPGNPLLTAHWAPKSRLQRAGHASWVQTPGGEWYMAHLCGRPNEWVSDEGEERPTDYANAHCLLGRETALQKLEWDVEGWPRLAGGGVWPASQVAAPQGVNVSVSNPEPARDGFDSTTLSPHWNTLRRPMSASWLSLAERPGWLRLRGGESLMSRYEQSLVGRRLQHHHVRAATRLDFAPQHFQQMAGLALYYGTRANAYLHVTAEVDSGQRVLRLLQTRDGAVHEPFAPLPLPLPQPQLDGVVELAVEVHVTTMQFFWRTGTGPWLPFGGPLPVDALSDEAQCKQIDGFFYSFGFTGTFIALACQDLAGTALAADFDHFDYEVLG
jgi:xylan 1,4-beta-xylosidase